MCCRRIRCFGTFYEDDDNSATTITSVRYIEMLENVLQLQLNELAADVQDIWLQQDGATEHIAKRTMRYLREFFPRHIISHRGDIHRPARSPDLAPCSFFVWGYLKWEVYKHRPHNLVELKTAIREEIQQLTPAMTVRMMNFRRRLNSCINTQRHHMEDVAFHKQTALTCEFGDINESLIWWNFKTFFACEIHPFFLACPVI